VDARRHALLSCSSNRSSSVFAPHPGHRPHVPQQPHGAAGIVQRDVGASASSGGCWVDRLRRGSGNVLSVQTRAIGLRGHVRLDGPREMVRPALCVPEAVRRPVAGGLFGPSVPRHHLPGLLAAVPPGDLSGSRAPLRSGGSAVSARSVPSPSLLGSTALCLLVAVRSSKGRADARVGSPSWSPTYLGTILGRRVGWRLNSAATSPNARAHRDHRAGESIVPRVRAWRATDLWPDHRRVDRRPRVGGCLWWAYFDVLAIARNASCATPNGESARASRATVQLPAPAHDRGHRPLALGWSTCWSTWASEPSRARRSARDDPASPRCTGVALYLLAQVAFKYRNWHTLSTPRLIAHRRDPLPDPGGGADPLRSGPWGC
jgi:hypothetical protein